MAIPHNVPAGARDVTHGLVGACALLALALVSPASVAHANTTMEVVNPGPEFNVLAAGNHVYLRARGGEVRDLQTTLLELKAQDGTPLGTDAVRFAAAPDVIKPDRIGAIAVEIVPNKIPRAGTYSALAQVSAVDAAGKAIPGQSFGFKCLRVPVELKVGDGEPIRFVLKRPIPFKAVTESVPLALRSSPPDVPMPTVALDKAGLTTTVGSNKYLVAGGSVTGVLQANELLVTATVPGNVKEATSKLRGSGPALKSDLEVALAFSVKDYWPWPLLVVFLGQLLSFSVARWVTRDRQANLNRARWQEIATDLDNLLLERPDLQKHPHRAALVELLRRAKRQDDEGDTDGAKASLVAAQTKFDELRAVVPPPAGVVAAQPGPSVQILDTPAQRTVDRTLQFIIGNPNPVWGPTPAVQWNYALNGGQRTPFDGPGGLRAARRFEAQGQYEVTAVAAGQAVAGVRFTVLRSPVQAWRKWVLGVDYAIAVLAVVIAAALAYIAIDRMESFGSVADYILAFVGGFGITETLKGFGQVLTKVRSA